MKKIVKLLVLLVCVFCLTGCGSESSDINFKNDTNLQQSLLVDVKEFQDNILQLSDEEIQAYINSENEEDTVISNALSSWTSITDIGDYESGDFSTMSAKLKKSSATYTCTLHFTERDVNMVVVFEDVDGEAEITDVSYEVSYSLGEKMAEAGLNTLMGMGIVFCVLIFISFIISLFKYIPVITEKLSKPKEKRNDKVDAVAVIEKTNTSDTSDDTELIAVISAAIAASENTSTDSFVVRSIKRRNTNKWHRA